jgi:hypothetical protein
MTMPESIRNYLQTVEDNLVTGDATEHTHRAALEALLEGIDEGVTAINEPRRIACGAPDFIVTRGQTPIGYVEAKDVGANLDIAGRSEQLTRYRESLNNLILTDYLTFHRYLEGDLCETARLGRLTTDGEIEPDREGIQAVADLLRQFFAQQAPTIARSDELARRMAALARMIRRLIEETFAQESERGSLHAQLQAFREALIPNLTPAEFADMYAQTITYGLFAARVRAPAGQDFTRESAAWNLPETNPFLRRLFSQIAGPDLDERIAWLVDDLARLLSRADMDEILRDFRTLGRRTRQEDPVVHFYETFLRAYNPDMRQTRGVYYTPEPVVSYIVRSIDYLLKYRFRRLPGLADRNVFILDPAVGTATFLYFVIRTVHDHLNAVGIGGTWNDYVENHLLPRVFGFELLMAPYTVAHMKLGLLLQETGYEFASDQRLGIYLTNALEKPITQQQTLGFAGFITEEANAAAEVKREKPIMVVLGNPPYSVSSANQSDHIEELMDRYKEAVRDERNIQPLSDDYIKFIRFAHDRIERTGHGIVGMITNHTYLSGLIHRGMREELLKSFHKIYVLNLHGNALVGETAPDGGPDENVFDIRQGVAIALFVKRTPSEFFDPPETARVYYADLWGRREGKYEALMGQDVSTTEWQELEPQPPHYFFVPKDFDLLSEYERGWSVPDIFPVNSSGIKTHRDHFVIDFDEAALRERIAALRDATISDREIARRFGLHDTSTWKLSEARAELQAWDDWEEMFTRCLYRPFDVLPIYYSDALIDRPRSDVMRHMLYENIALLAMRQVRGAAYSHFGVSKWITDNRVFFSNRGIPVVFPLYRYERTDEENRRTHRGSSAFNLMLFDEQETYETRRPNLSRQFIADVRQKIELSFTPDGQGDVTAVDDPAQASSFGPEDVLHYAYAVFHAPTYRERYAEFLKIDFPRLPLTADRALFAALAAKGEELAALHLMESPRLAQSPVRFPMSGSNEVVSRHPRYVAPGEPDPESSEPLEEGRVYINQTQHFAGITPDVWAFEIGGYQVLHKWLKDRKRADHALTFDDVQHYRKVVVALEETMRLMDEIDETIPSWPIA